MTSAERLAGIYSELAAIGLPCLVLGGHAVRYYGIDRNTVDFDLHIALPPEEWERLPRLLARSTALGTLEEGPSWRPGDFRRFAVGTLEDGRPEYLECWRRNHLLARFADLLERREEGSYGGGRVAFLGLADLIRSKETERESDWQDLALLEEIADQRNAARAASAESRAIALASLRSRRGYEDSLGRGWLSDVALVTRAIGLASNAVSLAFLAPSVTALDLGGRRLPPELTEQIVSSLRVVAPGSARHLALVEAVRRLHKRSAMLRDRSDKESALQQ